MKKNILPVIAVAIMVFLGACSNSYLEKVEEDVATKPEIGRTVTITASVPGDDNPTTRVNLGQDSLNVNLTWVKNDALSIAIVQDQSKFIVQANVDSVSNGGKRATFSFILPTDTDGFDENAPFDFYGVYGGNGISFNGLTPYAILPTSPGDATSLTSVQNRKDVMLSFKSEGYKLNNPTVVNFEHLGFLFSIKLKNIGNTNMLKDNRVKKIRLAGVGTSKWAYKGNGGQINLTNNEFSYTSGTNATNNLTNIPFTIDGQLNRGDSYEFWGWSTLTGVSWPALNLEVDYRLIGTQTAKTPTSKVARTPTIGNTYHVYATVAGTGIFGTNVEVNFVTKAQYDLIQ